MKPINSTLLGLAGAWLLIASTPLGADEAGHIRDLTMGDPYYYTSDQAIGEDDGQKLLVGEGRPKTTHSSIPHLPVFSGHMNTNYTYRFVNVVEQTMTMIGEGKHGLWRVQDNGTIREYRKKDTQGLPDGADLFDEANLATIENDYASYIPEESWGGYKHPHQRLTEDGHLNFIDLPLHHPKYKGKYDDHVAIDLPHFYCTMSANQYPYARKAVDYSFSQPGANQIGPLGKRAGLDVNELYTKVLRINLFPDARAWINVGGEDENSVDWQAVDVSKTNAEFYLIERPFFNEPYLFITAVFDNPDNKDFRYVRPDGEYYKHVKESGQEVKTEITYEPRFHLENGTTAAAKGLPVYGVHHPNRAAFGGGGACPLKGGDWSNYPKTTGAAGWPTNYEEVTPLCDGVLVDIKFYANLDGQGWDNPTKYLANAGHGQEEVTYTLEPGEYGVYTDPYLTEKGEKNPHAIDLGDELTLKYPAVEKPVTPAE
ncbi:MAG: hypothetical protein OXN23_06920 [Gammaproteobacteria bacterium]|nr:hypothetical protein [Gammaproteobacteria bacterium]